MADDLVYHLGHQFTLKRAAEYAAIRDARYIERPAEWMACFKDACRLGVPVTISRDIVPCNDPDRDCDLDVLYHRALPDGRVQMRNGHTCCRVVYATTLINGQRFWLLIDEQGDYRAMEEARGTDGTERTWGVTVEDGNDPVVVGKKVAGRRNHRLELERLAASYITPHIRPTSARVRELAAAGVKDAQAAAEQEIAAGTFAIVVSLCKGTGSRGYKTPISSPPAMLFFSDRELENIVREKKGATYPLPVYTG